MSTERLKERLEQIQQRIPNLRGRGEEATKQALVLPFLDALGFDIWNPNEICPEFDADVAAKKGGPRERVDLAVILDGTPRVFFEVKSADTSLDGHEGQLARYFNSVPNVSLGVLTNGIEYRFFTDTGEPNLMDATPFHVTRLDGVDLSTDVLARFHRSVFSPSAIRDYATELNYTARIVALLRAELDLRSRDPSEALVRWVLAQEAMYDGRVMASVVDRFRPIVRNALQQVLRDIVRRSVAALDHGVSAPPAHETAGPSLAATSAIPVSSQAAPTTDTVADDADEGRRIVTTERELQAFAKFKQWFAASPCASSLIFDKGSRSEVPIEIGYRDTTGYFAVYFNKPSWWVARLMLEVRQPWVAFNVPRETLARMLPEGVELLAPHAHGEARIALPSLDALERCGTLALAAMEQVIAERRTAS